MHLQTFKRYEDKFLLNEEQYDRLMNRLAPHMRLDSFCADGSYSICNVYFDTADNEILRRSVSKPYFKEKLRLRSYGVPADENSTVFLELKRKIGGEVSKRRASLSYGEARRYLETGEKPQKLSYTDIQVLRETDRFLEEFKVYPAVAISYDRIAMFGMEDHDLRITFDTNLRARRENVSLEKGGELLLPENIRLMEIKIPGAMPVELARTLSELGIFSRSFSKAGTEYKRMLCEKQLVLV